MLNRIILIGRLTRDPELRYTPQGVPVASFSLAVDRPFTNQVLSRNGFSTVLGMKRWPETLVARRDLSLLTSRLVAKRVRLLRATSDYDREKLQERLAKLAGGVAVIRVGGASEAEVKERKDRVDDALHATRAAVEEGIVPGGGVALARASLILSKVKADNDDQRFGIDIIRKAILVPMRQIAENAGEDGAVISGKVLDKDDYGWGFDAQSGEFKDLVKAGIIDPTKVVRTALQDAASVAGLLVTTEAMVAERPEKKSPQGGGGGGMGGMGGMGDMDF
jgi:chaperonin GroEL